MQRYSARIIDTHHQIPTRSSCFPRVRAIRLAVFCRLALLAGGTQATAIDPQGHILVAEGEGRTQILAGASETVRFAARELQSYVQRMTGARLLILEKSAS